MSSVRAGVGLGVLCVVAIGTITWFLCEKPPQFSEEPLRPATSPDGWHVERGMNACNTPQGDGPCDRPQDVPGFHYVGKFDNATACAETCVGQSVDDCPIWLWSSGSKHCFWRLDKVWAPVAQSDIVSACREGEQESTNCVPGCGKCTVTTTMPPSPDPPPSPFAPSQAQNMNGDYILSQTPKGNVKKYPQHYKDFPRPVQYFEVYSPVIKSLYSQVFWKGLDPVPLPDEIIKRYSQGKAMAVVGFEMDQVIRKPDGDVSVPINVAYNHHFESTMIGERASLEKIVLTGPEDPRVQEFNLDRKGHVMNLGPGSEHWVAIDLAEGLSAVPTSQHFGASNGGEYRKSYHGFPPGFAQIIESPKQIQITPMQIDTWNRDKMNLTGSPFVAGPLPRNNLAPPDANYSGLLECPVTTRLRKIVDGDYKVSISERCSDVVETASECFEAVAKTLPDTSKKVLNSTINDPNFPSGCSITASADGVTTTVYFNEKKDASGSCGVGKTARVGVVRSLVRLNVSLDLVKSEVEITMTGPDSVWFGVGFGAQAMKDEPWAIIVDGHGKVSERKLQDQNPGSELPQSVIIVSSTAVNGQRTVVLRRPMKGKTNEYYSFTNDQDVVLPFINAIGSGPDLAYHKAKTPASLGLLPVSASPANPNVACLCATHPAPFGSGKGSFSYQPVDQPGEMGTPTKIAFGNTCPPQPRTDLLAMKNPTCDVRSYVGGQIACHHMFSLLDADQEIPWVDQPLEYQMKFRFWYQDYNASYHTNVANTRTWGIASPVEYDVPKCEEGMMGCSKTEDGNWVHTITGTWQGEGTLVAAHFHCHAPTCLSFTMYRDWNGTHGEVLCEERPVYGGTGQLDDKKFDEPGFILQPPCLWGDEEFGLEPPPKVDGVTLHSVKTANANYGHHGEMAWQQMFFVDDPRWPGASKDSDVHV